MTAFSQLAASSGTEPVSVPLGKETVRVKPPMDWRSSAFEALREAKFTQWAQTSLVNDLATAEDGTVTGSNDVAIWNNIDPTIRDVMAFLTAYGATVGVSLGE